MWTYVSSWVLFLMHMHIWSPVMILYIVIEHMFSHNTFLWIKQGRVTTLFSLFFSCLCFNGRFSKAEQIFHKLRGIISKVVVIRFLSQGWVSIRFASIPGSVSWSLKFPCPTAASILKGRDAWDIIDLIWPF